MNLFEQLYSVAVSQLVFRGTQGFREEFGKKQIYMVYYIILYTFI